MGGRGWAAEKTSLTAACLWIARGVDPGTVQAWMGQAREASSGVKRLTWRLSARTASAICVESSSIIGAGPQQ